MSAVPGVHDTQSRLARHLGGWRRPIYRDGMALVTSSAISSGVGLLYWVLAARLYPPATVGIGSALVSTMMLLGSAGQLNLGVALLRFVPVAGSAARRLVGSCYVVGGTAAVLAGTGFALGARWWAPDLSSALGTARLVAYLTVAAPVWAVFVMQDYVLTAVRRAVLVPIANLGFALVKVGILVACTAITTANGIAVSWLAGTAMLVAGVTLLLPRLLGTGEPAREPVTARIIARFVRADYAGEMCWTAVVFGLPVLVLTRLGAEAAATFGITWTIAYALYLVPHGMGQSMVAHLAVEPAGLGTAWRGMVTRALALLVPAVAVLSLTAGPLLSIFGPHYTATGTAVLILSAASALPDVIVRATVSAARVRQRQRVLFGLPAAVTLGIFGAAWVLMPHLGLAGVGAALLGTQALAAAGVLVARRTSRHRGSET